MLPGNVCNVCRCARCRLRRLRRCTPPPPPPPPQQQHPPQVQHPPPHPPHLPQALHPQQLQQQVQQQGQPPPPHDPDLAPARPPRIATPWAKLWRLPVSNRVKVFAVRLLHGSIPCNAMVAAMRARPPSFVKCPACVRCAAAGTAIPPETYSHLFLECPTYRPVIDWLSRVWAALPQCTAPPLEPSVIITGEPGAPWQPAMVRAPVWHSLRLLTLSAIWDARVCGEPHRQTASAVVASVIASVAEEIKLQHARCCRRNYHARQLPPAVLAMRRLDDPPDDYAAWAAAGLCRVLGGGASGSGQLVVLLTASWPVMAPA